MILTPRVVVLVHPIDTVRHPDLPEGFRWGVYVGDATPTDIEFCMNAGFCPTVGEASFEGESHGAAVCRALRTYGIPAEYRFNRLDNDPIPCELDVPHAVLT